jgi:lycopene cyclase domain-containing protein
LNPKFLYLAINLISVCVPLAFSFHRKISFVKKWKYFWPAALTTAFIFTVWDSFFTKLGVWGFNPKYLLGIYVFNLPLEEILFFICIPYACVFTYEVVNYFFKNDHVLTRSQHNISKVLIVLLLIVGVIFINRLYTSITFISLAIFLITLEWKIKSHYMGQFYLTYIIILLPFFIVNGILTGSFIDQEVVWYNNLENLGIRMGTIPFEDIFYGMLMMLMNISIFALLQAREKQRQ